MRKKENNNSNKDRINEIEKNAGVTDEITINLKYEDKTKKGNKKTKKQRKNRVLKVILILIITVFVTFLGLFIKRMNENGWTLGGFVATIMGHNSKTLANLSRINILLVGKSQNLTDTILICSYDPKTQDAALLSIPRDTFTGHNKKYASASDKINALYQIDHDLLLERVNQITGLDIKYYIVIDTHALRDLVDSVGGIDFDVPIDMDYDDSSQNLAIHVKAGMQHLDGKTAEQVVRFRHNNDGSTYPVEYGQEDIGRMKTQRAFIAAVVKQLAKAENLTKIDDYIKIANNNVETNFSIWNLKDYAPYLIDYNMDELKTESLPGAPEKCNGLWFYIYNKKETTELINELFKSELTEEQEKNSKIKISILNGTNDEMNLNNLETLLQESGYTIVSAGSTSATKSTMIINRTNQTEQISNELKNVVGVGLIANSTNNEESDVDFTIIIGDDY